MILDTERVALAIIKAIEDQPGRASRGGWSAACVAAEAAIIELRAQPLTDPNAASMPEPETDHDESMINPDLPGFDMNLPSASEPDWHERSGLR